MTKAEVILEAVNAGASDEELVVLDNTDEKEFGNSTVSKDKKEEEKKISNAEKKRKKLEDDLKNQGLEDIDIIRELQNYDEEEELKFEQTQFGKGGLEGIAAVELPEIVIPLKNPISSILKIEDYNNKISSDDSVENTNNWLNSYIRNRGFSAEKHTLILQTTKSNHIKITAANGSAEIFKIKAGEQDPISNGQVLPVNSLEEITSWLDGQQISQDQKYVFNLTNQTPGEDGLYDIKLINKKDINTGTIVRPIAKELQFSASIDHAYKADGEQVEIITSLVHSSIEKAISNPESMGLSARYSSVRAGELSEDDKDEIRTAVFNRVNKKLKDAVINKADFNKLFTMYDGIVQQINTENNNAKNLSVSGEELNLVFKEDREKRFVASLKPKMKIKYGLLREIEKEEENLKNAAGNSIEMDRIKLVIVDLKDQIDVNAKTEVPIDNYHDMTFRAYGGKPPTVVIENPELSSMMFQNDYSANAVEEAGELAEEFKNLSPVELAILAMSLPDTMTDREIYEHYHDNVLKIRQNTEKEFLDKKITIDLWNLDPAIRKTLFQKFPQAKEFYPKDKGKSKFQVSIQKLYDAGFNSHKLDLPFLFGDTMPDADRALYEDYEAFRLKSIAQEISIKKMTRLNINPIDIKKNISMGGSILNGLWDGTKHAFGIKTQEGDLTRRQTLSNIRDAFDEYNSYAASAGGVVDINGKRVQLKQIKLTKDQLKAFEVSWNERIGETIGGFIPIAVQLSMLSAATGGVLSFTGAARILSTMKKSKNAFDRMKAFGINVGIEEFKLHGLMGFNLGDGLAFSTIGEATHGIGNFKKWGAIARLYQKTFKVGMVGATSLDAAKIVSDSFKHLQGDANFKEEFDKYFGDSSENVQRWLTHAAAFSFHGIHNIRKTDLMGEAGKYAAIRDIDKQMRELYTQVEIEPGIFKRVFGSAKLSNSEAIEKYDALLHGKMTIEQMIKEHETYTSLDPKTNPKWKETMENRFGNASDFQAKLRKENPEYKGFDIRFSENSADFYHGNAAQYNYKGSMFKGKKQDKPFILINPKLYKVGKVQHEALIHATVDAYFSQGGKKRKEVFIENVADKFKNIDFSVYITEANKGTREYKLAEFIDKYYNEPGSVKSEEFLGYMIEFLSKPEIYYEKVAQCGMQNIVIDMKTMLRENFNMYTDVKAKDAMELMAVVARGLEGGKFNEKTFDTFMKLLEKPVEEGGLDIISANTELTTTTVTPRGSKDTEIIDLNNRKTEILKIINTPSTKPKTEAEKVEMENLRLEFSQFIFSSTFFSLCKID